MRRWPVLLWWTAIGCGWGPASGPPDTLRCDHPGHDKRCFVQVPGGTFPMGAQATDPQLPGYDPDARPDEGPVHAVTVSSFWMQADEVQLWDWLECVKSGACPDAPGPVAGLGAMGQTAAQLTWDEARAYCGSLGGRLPTEAEWEFVARSGGDRRFPWGNKPPCALGRSDDAWHQAPPGQRAIVRGCEADSPSARDPGDLPIRDLAWGHWEWTADWYDASAYTAAAVTNPKGPPTGTRRVQRGGSWAAEDPVDHRSAARMSMLPDARVFDVGVRCAW